MNEACRQLNQKTGCEFKTKKSLDLVASRLNNDLMDIEGQGLPLKKDFLQESPMILGYH